MDRMVRLANCSWSTDHDNINHCQHVAISNFNIQRTLILAARANVRGESNVNWAVRLFDLGDSAILAVCAVSQFYSLAVILPVTFLQPSHSSVWRKCSEGYDRHDAVGRALAGEGGGRESLRTRIMERSDKETKKIVKLLFAPRSYSAVYSWSIIYIYSSTWQRHKNLLILLFAIFRNEVNPPRLSTGERRNVHIKYIITSCKIFITIYLVKPNLLWYKNDNMMGVLGTVIDILPVSSVTSKSVNYSRYYRLTVRTLGRTGSGMKRWWW